MDSLFRLCLNLSTGLAQDCHAHLGVSTGLKKEQGSAHMCLLIMIVNGFLWFIGLCFDMGLFF